MISFINYLSEATAPFQDLPTLSVMSLDDFVSTQGMQTEAANEKFGMGAKTRMPSDEEVADRLKAIFSGTVQAAATRPIWPYLHRSMLVPQNEEGNEGFLLSPGSSIALDVTHERPIDVNALKKIITTRPAELISQNKKMTKSGDGKTVFFNFGVPAMTGLVVNEKTNEFVVVTTCPGAGTCIKYCYAMKGGYVQFIDTSMRQTRILNWLVNDPAGFFKQIRTELKRMSDAAKKKDLDLVIRWHDAGDFFSPIYLRYFYSVVKSFPDVQFYAYTKLGDVAAKTDNPPNLTINFSDGARQDQLKKVDMSSTKHSKVVQKELFKDLMVRDKMKDENGDVKSSLKFTSPRAMQTFKERLATEYDIPEDSILSYKEMMKTPLGSKKRWNVFVVPGEGDTSASRSDVLGTYLLIH